MLLTRSGWCFLVVEANFPSGMTNHMHSAQIWVVSAVVSKTSFRRETSGGILKYRLFSQDIFESKYPGSFLYISTVLSPISKYNLSRLVSIHLLKKLFDRRSRHFPFADHFIKSHDLFSRRCTDIIRRKQMLATLGI